MTVDIQTKSKYPGHAVKLVNSSKGIDVGCCPQVYFSIQ